MCQYGNFIKSRASSFKKRAKGIINFFFMKPNLIFHISYFTLSFMVSVYILWETDSKREQDQQYKNIPLHDKVILLLQIPPSRFYKPVGILGLKVFTSLCKMYYTKYHFSCFTLNKTLWNAGSSVFSEVVF